MSTHNICFHGEIRKFHILCGYPRLSVSMVVKMKIHHSITWLYIHVL